MKFLLVNTNAAVKKIFSLTARKAGINLDMVNSMSGIHPEEDYACIFIDDGVLDSGTFQTLKGKMLTTKFCLILSKDKPIISGFDSFIRKPFLPTDIYEVLKKEKYNDMNLYDNDGAEAKMPDISIKSQDSNLVNEAIREALPNRPAPKPQAQDSAPGTNIADINLDEFSDSNDEFLSPRKPISHDDIGIKLDDMGFGARTSQPRPAPKPQPQHAPDDDFDTSEIKFTYDDDEANEPNSAFAHSFVNHNAESDDALDLGDLPSDFGAPNDIDSAPSEPSPSVARDSATDSAIQDSAPPPRPKPTPRPAMQDDSDEIDFSSIFAMQDEFLQSQEQEQKKGLIGGDISTKKGDSPSEQIAQDSALDNMEDTADMAVAQDSAPQDSAPPPPKPRLRTQAPANPAPKPSSPNMIHNFDDMSEFEDLDMDDYKSTPNPAASVVEPIAPRPTPSTQEPIPANPRAPQSPQPRNINDFSDDELEKLDDDELLQLQEDSISAQDDFQDLRDERDYGISESELNAQNADYNPQILNKDDIDEVSNILNDTQSGDFKIESGELGSLTHEALSEVLDEGNIDRVDDYSANSVDSSDFGDDFRADSSDNFNDTPSPHTSASANAPSDDFAPQISPNTRINIGDSGSSVNLDLGEIIKTFPVDKLRELLSGVQITINITFPSKAKKP